MFLLVLTTSKESLRVLTLGFGLEMGLWQEKGDTIEFLRSVRLEKKTLLCEISYEGKLRMLIILVVVQDYTC